MRREKNTSLLDEEKYTPCIVCKKSLGADSFMIIFYKNRMFYTLKSTQLRADTLTLKLSDLTPDNMTTAQHSQTGGGDGLPSYLQLRVFSSITVLVMLNMAALGSRYIQKYLSFQPSLGFVFSALISGVMSSDISSCYKVSDRRLTLTGYLLSLLSRLTRAGPTPPCWMSSPLSRPMKSVRSSAG